MATTKRPKGLGMGLDALLSPLAMAPIPVAAVDAVASAAATKPPAVSTAADLPPTTLPLASLRPGRYQPRSRMDEPALRELADSIATRGVMQPILVRPHGDAWEIIAGERRFRAARIAGLTDVPVVVHAVDDHTAAVMALVENMQREDLNAMDEARGLQRLVDEFHLTHEEAARAVGRSRSAATNLMRLLQLAPPVQAMVEDGTLQMGHARALLPLAGAQQVLLAGEIAARSLTVRDTEARAGRLLRGGASGSASRTTPGRAEPAAPNGDTARLQERLSDLLGVDVRIQAQRSGAGTIVLGYASLDALDALVHRLGLRDE